MPRCIDQIPQVSPHTPLERIFHDDPGKVFDEIQSQRLAAQDAKWNRSADSRRLAGEGGAPSIRSRTEAVIQYLEHQA